MNSKLKVYLFLHFFAFSLLGQDITVTETSTNFFVLWDRKDGEYLHSYYPDMPYHQTNVCDGYHIHPIEVGMTNGRSFVTFNKSQYSTNRVGFVQMPVESFFVSWAHHPDSDWYDIMWKGSRGLDFLWGKFGVSEPRLTNNYYVFTNISAMSLPMNVYIYKNVKNNDTNLMYSHHQIQIDKLTLTNKIKVVTKPSNLSL